MLLENISVKKVVSKIVQLFNTDEMPIWYIGADFISNLSIPKKSNTPNKFHWVGGLRIRPLMITHPGLNKAFCYMWNETEGKKGALNLLNYYF